MRIPRWLKQLFPVHIERKSRIEELLEYMQGRVTTRTQAIAIALEVVRDPLKCLGFRMLERGGMTVFPVYQTDGSAVWGRSFLLLVGEGSEPNIAVEPTEPTWLERGWAITPIDFSSVEKPPQVSALLTEAMNNLRWLQSPDVPDGRLR